ncbi:hypothetical protein GVAV_000534 [Gurleya vavrai]
MHNTNKPILAKKYKIFLFLILFTTLSLGSCTLIGFFTSKKDDQDYIEIIQNDIKQIIENSTDSKYFKIKKLVDFGIFYISKENTNVNFYNPTSNSQAKLKREMNESKSFFLIDDFKKSREEIKLQVTYKNLKETELMKNTRFLSSFGNTFCYRLLPLVKTILNSMVEFVNLTNEQENGFMIVSLEEESFRLCLFEVFDGDWNVNILDYYMPKKNDFPSVKDITKHLLCKIVEM